MTRHLGNRKAIDDSRDSRGVTERRKRPWVTRSVSGRERVTCGRARNCITTELSKTERTWRPDGRSLLVIGVHLRHAFRDSDGKVFPTTLVTKSASGTGPVGEQGGTCHPGVREVGACDGQTPKRVTPSLTRLPATRRRTRIRCMRFYISIETGNWIYFLCF